MSALVRMAARIAIVEILRADPVIGPATEGRVLDSDMSAIDPKGMAPGSSLPTIIVNTEGDSGEHWSENNGGPPFDSRLEIVFEVTHVASFDHEGEAILFRPETSRELEAAIDLLEWRIPEAIAFAETPLAATARRLVIKRIREARSERFASDDIGVRIASRILTLVLDLHDEAADVFHPDDPLPTGPFAALPEPLRSLAPLFSPGSSAAAVMTMVAERLQAPAHVDEFIATDIEIDGRPDGFRPAT